ncbi:sigma-70 family RNA polymerase sigma factor [Limnoglobus roseus]|uniref:sigma-70 family RNA polymerase sigma factor n=1 Tax=Limnoglobus roseus TaxID=2598579 RepID=UPI0011EAE343|nr:sigma-70 family RNA polymerase sigma factor [Limnoglobus roseus]
MPTTTCPTSRKKPPLLPTAERNAVALSVFPLLLKLCREAVPCQHDADDAGQISAVRILETARGYDPEKGRPGTWAGFKVKSVLSARRRSREYHAAHVSGHLSNPEGILDHRGPERDVDREDLADRIRTAIATVPARHRRVLRLRFTAGLTLSEVGERLGLSETAAWHRVNAAITAAWLACRRAGLKPGVC